MTCGPAPSVTRFLFILALFPPLVVSSLAQKATPPSSAKPINLDRELEEPVRQDRAASYYHFSLAKWSEEQGELSRAVSEMRMALKYNTGSASVHLEMAGLMAKTGNIQEAIEYAQKAAELDPKDPGPHWLLANLYFRPRMRGDSATADIKMAVKELEKLRELSPSDERVYYALGGAYFELDQPEKAIEAYETFQKLSSGVDNGYREIARYYDAIGNYEKAVEYLLLALKTQPESMESLTMLAGIYLKQNKNMEAIPIYRKLLALTGGNAAAGRQLASLLIESGENGEAMSILEGIVKSAPGDPISQILMGRAQIGLRKYKEAIDTLKSVSTNDSNINMEAQFYLGRAYEESGDRQQAIEVFSRLLRQTPASDEQSKGNRLLFQQRLAANYWESGERQKAIEVYEQMSKADPKANILLLQAYRIDRQLDKALSLGKEQFEKDPSSLPIAIEYAQALADAGRVKEGTDILTKLLQTNPEELDLYIALSQVYVQDKRFSDAERALIRAEEKAVKEEPEKARIKFQKAALFERKKEYDRAESLFKELLRDNPSNAMVLNYLGYMLADRGVRLEEAMRYIQQALEIEPRNGAYLDSLGWVYFKLNDLPNAEKYLLEADSIVKNDPTIVDHLGDLYYRMGDFKKAESYWLRSIDIGTDPDETRKVRKKLEALQDKLRRQKSIQ